MNTNNTQGSQEGVYASEPRVYELGYHILSSVDEGNVEKEREALVAIITKLKGMVITEELPALIDLAYNMDKVIDNKRHIFSQAYFGWIKFDLSPDSIENLDEKVEALDSVLRHIVVKTVRENTIVSDEPYRLARTNTKNDVEEVDETDEVERPTADEAPKAEVAVEEVVETPTVETDSEKSKDVADDLTKIEGIGPKIAEIFVAAGIKTFADLSDSKVADLRELLEENKLSSHDPKTWSKQATLAKNEKWDKLAELQDELKGGK